MVAGHVNVLTALGDPDLPTAPLQPLARSFVHIKSIDKRWKRCPFFAVLAGKASHKRPVASNFTEHCILRIVTLET